MNLIQKVTRNGTSIAAYRYLYDCTKTNAMCRLLWTNIVHFGIYIGFDKNSIVDKKTKY